ncbi:hypothetical protein ACQ86N_01920 [Puia sp. P3]|uniref:hypothetical protein n=1 Tax=Puia sp. P3 TaxID=3423952 RepID=UPI003D67D2E7
MNQKNSSLLRKSIFLLGALTIGWAAEAQTGTIPSDSTHRFHRKFDGAGREGGRETHGFAREGRGFERGGRGFGHGRAMIHYTPEQRQQVAAINKEYRQKSSDLYKKDNITLREYKASLVALQKEKKSKMEALLTPKQKEEMAARRKRMTEDRQVMAAAHIERLRLRLDLSDDQVSKIKAGQESLHAQAKAIHENDNLLPQEKMEQMKSLMAKRNDTFKSVLTPEQYSQYEKMSQHRGGRFGRRFGPGGDRGGMSDHGGSNEKV